MVMRLWDDILVAILALAFILVMAHPGCASDEDSASAFCSCNPASAKSCASAVFTLPAGTAAALTDMTIANNSGSPADIQLEDGTGTKVEYFAPTGATTTHSFKTPIFFITKAQAVCGNGSNDNTSITVSGRLVPVRH